ncbi:MAG: DUF4393 domain-containing protein [Burkholderiales bacterium]|nr:DUF4393 domain-containing protein [Burkholderiales bacterium]
MDSPIKVDITDSANEIIKQLALPATAQIGQALGNVFGLVNTITLPIKFCNVYAQRNFAKYCNKLNKTPIDKIKEVEPEIAIPIIEKLSYTSNQELANASNSDKVDLIHPGFIEKINNMAPDEARIINHLKGITDLYYIVFRAKNSNNSTYHDLSYKLTHLCSELTLEPQRVSIHLENLVSLSVLQDNVGAFKIDESTYDKLINQYSDSKQIYELQVNNKKFMPLDTLVIEKSFYSVTNLGRVFIDACTFNDVP